MSPTNVRKRDINGPVFLFSTEQMCPLQLSTTLGTKLKKLTVVALHN